MWTLDRLKRWCGIIALVAGTGVSAAAHDLPGDAAHSATHGWVATGGRLRFVQNDDDAVRSVRPSTLLQSLFGELKAAGKPPAATSFAAYQDTVKVRWDDRWLYVESNGMPNHRMMVGITAWQQQVPLPQPYTGANAWQIPLHPVVAKDPLSANSHFFRGAIAVAANGVPIFNPIKNDGKTDTFLASELDEFGGHCGRGDDYHYHIAPLHLQKIVGADNPIAYALDGYSIYGLTEPDGSAAGKLDALNGHTDARGNYHYHATKTYPYLNGGFHGEVVEAGGQVDPQPRAAGVRDAGRPIRGAKITEFTSTKPNAYTLVYDVSGTKYKINYEIVGDGTYRFEYVDGGGKSTTEIYRQRGGGEGAGPRAAPVPQAVGGGNAPGSLARLLPGGVEARLGLTDAQTGQLAALSAEVKAKLAKILTIDQMKLLESARPPGAPPGSENGENRPRPANEATAKTELAKPSTLEVVKPVAGFVLRSPAIGADSVLPKEFTGDGASISPPLEWTGAPSGTVGYAIVMHHIDPGGNTKWYWVVYGIGPDQKSLAKDSKGVGTVGNNSVNGRLGYAPPHSKGPGLKTYILTVYALSAAPKLTVPAAQVSREVLLNAIKENVLATAELKVTYDRTGVADAGASR